MNAFTCSGVGPGGVVSPLKVNVSPAETAEVPAPVVTFTSTAPAACAGAVACTEVADSGVTAVAATPPNVTPVAPVRFVPVIVTTVPPAIGPDVGLIDVTVGSTGGAAVKVNVSPAEVAEVPAGVVTFTSTAPAACAGEVACTDVALTKLNAAAAVPPNDTPVTPVRLVPVIVTTVPPAIGPDVGDNEVTVGSAGGATNVYLSPAETTEVPPGVMTVTSTRPAACAGATAVAEVADTGVTAVAAAVPKVTAVMPVRFVPVIVTTVPPAIGPDVGLIEVTVGRTGGAPTKVNVSPAVTAEVPAGVITVTSTAPATCAGDVTFIDVAETGVNAVPPMPPKLTTVAPVRLAPVIVITVPPAIGPEVGDSDVTVGGAAVVTKVKKSPVATAEVPPGVVTFTSTPPAACAGEVAVIEVALMKLKPAAAVPPNDTPVTPVKLVPVIVTTVAPAVEPEVGDSDVTVGGAGGATNVNLSAAETAEIPPGVITVMSTMPAACAGEVAVIDVAEIGVSAVPAPVPNDTAVAPVRLVPVIVTTVAPAVVPEVGLMAVIVGAPAGATNVYLSPAERAEVPPGVVTVTSTWPAACDGAVAVTDVADTNENVVAALPPNDTPVTPVRLVPVIVTTVPPAVEPDVGLSEVTVGAGGGVA